MRWYAGILAPLAAVLLLPLSGCGDVGAEQLGGSLVKSRTAKVSAHRGKASTKIRIQDRPKVQHKGKSPRDRLRRAPNKRPNNPPKDPPNTPPQDPPQQPAPGAGELDGREDGLLVGILAAHNSARQKVGVGNLTWSRDIAIFAQGWANDLAANNCELAHNPNRPYGENLYWTTTPRDVQTVVQAWVAEAANYDAVNHTCTSGICGHYTQVVWSATTKLGCGVARCDNTQVWVCNYDPPGNYYGVNPF